VSEEVIYSKILADFLNLTFVFGITGETYSFFLAYRLMHGFTFKFDTDYTKQRSIDTMTPNKLAVYFCGRYTVLADMVVVDIDFPCGRYGFFTVADIVLLQCGRYGCGRYDLWPIWSHPVS